MSFSRDTCCREAEIFSGSVERNNRRSVGVVNTKRCSKIRFSVNSSFCRDKRNTCKCKKFTHYTAGGRKIIKKRCNRDCLLARHSQRFLLNIFPSTQEIRRPQTSYTSASSQQVSQETTLQNGFFKHSVESNSTGRLGHKSRLDRCLHAHTHSQGSQEISKVLYSGQGVPIHLPLFRSSSGPQGVHKGGVCSSGTPQNSKFTSSCLPRRLVPSESDKKVIICRQKDCTQSLCRSRFHDKLKKISIGTKSVGNLYWGTFPISKRVSLSNSRESAQNKRSMHEVKDSTYSSELPSFVRANGFLHRTGAKRKAFHETNTIASPTFLERDQQKWTFKQWYHSILRYKSICNFG